MFGLYFFGLVIIMAYVAINAVAFDKLSKRVAAPEGDPETLDSPREYRMFGEG